MSLDLVLTIHNKQRLKTRVEESTRLTCTLLCVELEHLKIETRLIGEMLPSEMGEYVFLM